MKIKADKPGIRKECSFEANANAVLMDSPDTIWTISFLSRSELSENYEWTKISLLKKRTSEQFWSWEHESRGGP